MGKRRPSKFGTRLVRSSSKISPQFFYRDSHSFALVYDTTDRQSFFNLSYWLKQVKAHGAAESNLMLVASKCDLASKQEVTAEQGQKFADSRGMHFVEISARSNHNVDTLFEHLVSAILRRTDVNFLYAQPDLNVQTVSASNAIQDRT
mmetsp:Transcript_50417/g.114550  ORF Transcript_50417/g.114550 Transcript_50417/m.114550 type:complete len:148 (-) Transcript_50417:108-551(-)